MAFILIVLGAVLLDAGARNTATKQANGQPGLFELIQGDFSFSQSSGNESFLTWFVAILIIGALGYVKELRGFSNAFLALVIIGLVISKGGLFTQLQNEVGILSGQSVGGSAGPRVHF